MNFSVDCRNTNNEDKQETQKPCLSGSVLRLLLFLISYLSIRSLSSSVQCNLRPSWFQMYRGGGSQGPGVQIVECSTKSERTGQKNGGGARERKNVTPPYHLAVLPAHFAPSSLSECLKQASVALMCFFSLSPSPLFALAPQARFIAWLDLGHLKPRSPVRVGVLEDLTYGKIEDCALSSIFLEGSLAKLWSKTVQLHFRHTCLTWLICKVILWAVLSLKVSRWYPALLFIHVNKPPT